MQLELLGQPREGSGAELKRQVGAAVVRPSPTGGVLLELGPADGPPHVRLTLSAEEATRLSATVHAVAHGGSEAILLVED